MRQIARKWRMHGIKGESENKPVWTDGESTDASQVQATVPCPSILLGLLLVAVLAWPSPGAESNTADGCSAAAAVLQRFTARQGEPSAWPSETIQIDASLPKLKKAGRLQAIRTLFPAGPPAYKVLQIAGDPMVTHQVIMRYMSADEQTKELPALSVALTSANYKIHYAGSAGPGNR